MHIRWLVRMVDMTQIVFLLRLTRISSVRFVKRYNEHLFCNECLTQHLKNSKTCPVCKEDLTEETLLNKPSRIVTNMLNAQIIKCDHSERGCTESIELGRLEVHSHTCGYKPMSCPNDKCAKIMNLADLEQHTSEVCECRQVNCEECEKVMTYKKYSKHKLNCY